MSTNTTRTPIYAVRSPEIPTVKFLSFWVVRPQALVLGAVATLIGLSIGASALAIRQSIGTVDMSIAAVLGLAGGQTFLHLAGIGRAIAEPHPGQFIHGMWQSLVAGICIAAALFVTFPQYGAGYSIGFGAWLAAIAFVALLRPIVRSLIKRHHLTRTLMILGADDMAERVYRELAAVPDAVTPPGPPGIHARGNGQPRVSRIVVTDARTASRRDLTTLIDSKLRGTRIEQAVDSCEELCGKIWLAGLQPEWWVYSDGFVITRRYRMLKPIVDVLSATLLIAITSPLLAISALLIKLTSRGPVFYRQERVGRYGEVFRVLKFRSMYTGAEAETGPTWARENDSRITPLGKVLRKFRIDELPQLYNVLKGDMSFVGPRPERPHFVQMLRRELPYYDVRHYVKPGVTGWAQVKYPYGASIADAYEKLQYDLYYLKHMSLLLDVVVMLKTIRVVTSGNGR